MDLVDTHCHIQSAGAGHGERTTRELWAQSPQLSANKIIINAREHGVTNLVCVGCDPADSQLAVNFVQGHVGTWAAIGIHPHEARHFADQPEVLKQFVALVSKPKVVAVGECGLDYHYMHSPRPEQLEILKFQMQLALDNDLPLIFHVREGFGDFWPVFDSLNSKQKPLRGVLHSFTDNADNLAEGLKRGLMIGVNGIATFSKDQALEQVYKSIPLDHLLLETDAPYLAPVPHRGSVNEPKHIRAIADFLAKLRGESLDDLAAGTTANARQLFSI